MLQIRIIFSSKFKLPKALVHEQEIIDTKFQFSFDWENETNMNMFVNL